MNPWMGIWVGVVTGLVGGWGKVSANDEVLPRSAAGTEEEISALCDGFAPAAFRVVWRRQAGTSVNDDVFGDAPHAYLMGLDSVRGEARRILEPAGNYQKPLITPKGNRVVFSDRESHSVWAVGWDGTGLRKVASGLASDVWISPEGREWVVLIEGPLDPDHYGGTPLVRVELDDPANRKVLWDKTPVGLDNVQLSRDGRRACGLYPWPNAGVLDLVAQKWERYGKGCWTSLSPDDRYVLWVFDGAHRNLTLHASEGSSWQVPIHGAPGTGGYEVYHPRWSNHVRFFAMTGPYKAGTGRNRIAAGGPEVEVYVGRFDRELRTVESWCQVTHNGVGDFSPDLRIEPDSAAALDVAVGAPSMPSVRRAGDTVVVRVRLDEKSHQPSLNEIHPYRSALVVHAYQVVEVVEGALEDSSIAVAHWAIRNGKAVADTRKVGSILTMRVEPYDSHDELQGERCVIDITDITLPWYYDLGS